MPSFVPCNLQSALLSCPALPCPPLPSQAGRRVQEGPEDALRKYLWLHEAIPNEGCVADTSRGGGFPTHCLGSP